MTITATSTTLMQKSWVLRGVFLVFVGTLVLASLQLDEADTADRPSETYRLVNASTGYALWGCGGVYLCMGVLCFRRLKAFYMARVKKKKLFKAERQYLSAQKVRVAATAVGATCTNPTTSAIS